MRRVIVAVLVVCAFFAMTLFALSAQNQGCLPWQERVGIGDGPFGPEEDITACR